MSLTFGKQATARIAAFFIILWKIKAGMGNKESFIYTFIMDFREGTYTSQIYANSLSEGILKWAQGLEVSEIKHLGEKSKKEIIAIIIAADPIDKPALLEGLVNVWYFGISIPSGSLHVNIVKTHPAK